MEKIMGAWNLISNPDYKYVIAICSFRHENSHTLSFKIGDRLEVVEENGG